MAEKPIDMFPRTDTIKMPHRQQFHQFEPEAFRKLIDAIPKAVTDTGRFTRLGIAKSATGGCILRWLCLSGTKISKDHRAVLFAAKQVFTEQSRNIFFNIRQPVDECVTLSHTALEMWYLSFITVGDVPPPLSQKSLRSFAKTVQNRYEAKDTRIYIPQENAKRGVYVKGLPEDRAILLARYMIENNATVRACASKFGVSKSTVHKDITTRLAGIHKPLAAEVKKVLETNKAERHIRGGLATKEKYELSARYYKKKQKKAP